MAKDIGEKMKDWSNKEKLKILTKWIDDETAEKLLKYAKRLLKKKNIDIETIWHAERSIRKNIKLLKLLAKY